MAMYMSPLTKGLALLIDITFLIKMKKKEGKKEIILFHTRETNLNTWKIKNIFCKLTKLLTSYWLKP